MTVYADLEISLRRHTASGYVVDLRYSQPDSDADIRLAHPMAILHPLNSIANACVSPC